MSQPPADRSRRPVATSFLIRQIHLFLGMLIAPSLLMFAFSGGLQIFRLQEAHPDYKPPVLIEKLGRLHKDQVFAVAPPKPPRPDRPARAAAPRPETERAGPPLSKRILQWFFALVAFGLFLSTSLGIWLGCTMGRWRVAARWTLLAGVVIPVVALLI